MEEENTNDVPDDVSEELEASIPFELIDIDNYVEILVCGDYMCVKKEDFCLM